MNRHLLIKSLTIGFVFLTIYYLLDSIFNIFYFYPHLFGSRELQNLTPPLQKGLFNKAIITYFSLLIYSFISITLVTKPKEEIKNIHLIASILIFVVSIFFFKQTFESNLFIFFVRSYLAK